MAKHQNFIAHLSIHRSGLKNKTHGEILPLLKADRLPLSSVSPGFLICCATPSSQLANSGQPCKYFPIQNARVQAELKTDSEIA